MRILPDARLVLSKGAFCPFSIHGADNVILETIKRGDDDGKKSETSIILRVYEILGGHAKVRLRISSNGAWRVRKASLTNLLEDVLEELHIHKLLTDSEELELQFRGFEVKTVKLVMV